MGQTLQARPAAAAPQSPTSRAQSGADALEFALAQAVEEVSKSVLARKPAQRLDELLQLLTADVEASAASNTTPALPAAERISATQSAVDEALRRHDLKVKDALNQAGLSAAIVDLVQSLVTLHVDARAIQTRVQLGRLLEASGVHAETVAVAAGQIADVNADPFAPLTAAEIGKVMGGLSDETVRQREKAGELFSFLRPGRKRGREYPAFQTWPGIAGDPLIRILRALGDGDGASAYGFFSSASPELGRLTPVEALTGKLTKARGIDAAAAALLSESPPARLDAVVGAAGAYAADLAA
jgi:hypothetical protein